MHLAIQQNSYATRKQVNDSKSAARKPTRSIRRRIVADTKVQKSHLRWIFSTRSGRIVREFDELAEDLDVSPVDDG